MGHAESRGDGRPASHHGTSHSGELRLGLTYKSHGRLGLITCYVRFFLHLNEVVHYPSIPHPNLASCLIISCLHTQVSMSKNTCYLIVQTTAATLRTISLAAHQAVFSVSALLRGLNAPSLHNDWQPW